MSNKESSKKLAFLGGNPMLDVLGIDAQGFGVDVAEDRAGAEVIGLND